MNIDTMNIDIIGSTNRGTFVLNSNNCKIIHNVNTDTNTSLSDLLLNDLQTWLTQTGAPSVSLSVINVDNTEINLSKGLFDISNNIEIKESDPYRVASLSKPLCSALIFKLIEKNQLSLTDKISDFLGQGWLSDVNGWGDLMTIGQCLSHRDGFPGYELAPSFYIYIASKGLDYIVTIDDIMLWAKNEGLLFAPGTSYNYNTTGYFALGKVIEQITNKPISTYMKEQLFIPTNANNTELVDASNLTQNSEPIGYTQGDNALLVNALFGSTYDILNIGPLSYFGPNVSRNAVRTAGGPGGGVIGITNEIAKIFKYIFTSYLTSDSVNTMTTVKTTNSLDPVENTLTVDYCYGVRKESILNNIAYTKRGGLPGFQSWAVFIPESKLTVVLNVNCNPTTPFLTVLRDTVMNTILTYNNSN